jgi:hypothetical protein
MNRQDDRTTNAYDLIWKSEPGQSPVINVVLDA